MTARSTGSGATPFLQGVLVGTLLTACALFVVLIAMREQPGADLGSPAGAFEAGPDVVATPETGLVPKSGQRSGFGMPQGGEAWSARETAPSTSSEFQAPAGLAERALLQSEADSVGEGETDRGPVPASDRGSIDPVVPRLEALRDALQEVLARFPTAKDESTWTPGAGTAAEGEMDAWIRSTVENSNRRRPRTDTYYLDKARKEAKAKGWPESLAVELSLGQLLPPLVRSFDELLRESSSRQGKSSPLAIEDLGGVPSFDELCGHWSGMPFMQAVRQAGDGWKFVIETKGDRPLSPAGLVVWLECLEHLGEIRTKLGLAGSGVEYQRIAQEVWGATEYPNLLTTGVAIRSAKWARERLQSMGWAEPAGGVR